MIGRAAATAGIAVAAALALGGAPAAAQQPAEPPIPPRRVVIVWLDHTTLDDWDTDATPTLRAVVRAGTVGTLTAATSSRSLDPVELRASAAATVGASARSAIRVAGSQGTLTTEGTAGLLGIALTRAGVPFVAVGGAGGDDRGDRTARHVLASATTQVDGGDPSIDDPSFPTGKRADPSALISAVGFHLRSAGVILVDPGDTARVERVFAAAPRSREAWLARAMGSTETLVAGILPFLTTDDLLMLVSASPSADRASRSVRLGAAALLGGRFADGGVLASASSAHRGLASIEDIGPTILDHLGQGVPTLMNGNPMVAATATDPRGLLSDLERDLAKASSRHAQTSRAVGTLAFLTIAVSLGFVIAGRGRVGRRRLMPSGGRDSIATALVAVCALPALAYASDALPWRSLPLTILMSVAIAMTAAVAGRMLIGTEATLGVVTLASALLVLVDVARGSPLGIRSSLVTPLADGGRTTGLDAAVPAVAGAGLVLGIGILADAFPRTALRASAALRAPSVMRATRAAGPARLAVTATFAAASTALVARLLGASATGPAATAGLAVAGGLAVTARRAGGGGWTRPDSIAVAIAVAFGGATIAMSLPGGVAEPRDIAVLAWAPVGGIHVAWLCAIVASAGSFGVILRRRRLLLGRGLWGRPGLRAGLWGAAAVAAALLVGAEPGLVGVAVVGIYAAAALLVPLVAPDR